MRSPVRTSMLAVLTLALCLGPCEALRAASPPGVQWVADMTPDPSVGYLVDSAHRLADGSVLVLESQPFVGVTATHLDASGCRALRPRASASERLRRQPQDSTVDPFGAVFVGLTATRSSSRSLGDEVRRPDGSPAVARTLRVSTRPAHGHALPQSGSFSTLTGMSSSAGLSGSQSWTPFLFKLDGTTGRVLWGPVVRRSVDARTWRFYQVGVDARGRRRRFGQLGRQREHRRPDRGVQVRRAHRRADSGGPPLRPPEARGRTRSTYSALDPAGNLVVAGATHRRHALPTRRRQVRGRGRIDSVGAAAFRTAPATGFASVNFLRARLARRHPPRSQAARWPRKRPHAPEARGSGTDRPPGDLFAYPGNAGAIPQSHCGKSSIQTEISLPRSREAQLVR